MPKANPQEPSGLRPDPERAGGRGGLLTTMSSEAVRAVDRFAWYSDQIQQHIFPITLSTPYTADFRSEVSALRLGAVQVARFAFPPLEAARTARHIRSDDPETYQLGWMRRGAMAATQLRNDAFVGPGDMVLFGTSHPLRAGVRDEGSTVEVVVLRIPKNALPLPSAQADRLLARRLAPEGVSGALLHQHLHTLLARASEVGPAEAHRLGTITADLVASFAAERLDTAELVPWETRTTVLRARINAFITHHLGDPELRPAVIAAHHHISLRTLHALFQQEPATVAATIRHRRLERCRADLADPGMSDRPIAAIAARWGLLVPAEFSRAFRAAYGTSPGEYRAETARLRRSARDHKPLCTHPQADPAGRRHDEDSPTRAAC
ncbi:AraC family transcriptional regulator [Streptomyces litmocidini]|uniref:AraC-like ligand-binding domain-containing protein n=1 Tax=Streptomyces litmocidini TaxID=67318 RepID=UPI00167D6AC7|nr:helix-turn-helix domain-containing protein [Streptomyces litmocidini]GGV07828.1 AraC family transcriptional regulator [Streptomyces litmocidini]